MGTGCYSPYPVYGGFSVSLGVIPVEFAQGVTGLKSGL